MYLPYCPRYFWRADQTRRDPTGLVCGALQHRAVPAAKGISSRSRDGGVADLPVMALSWQVSLLRMILTPPATSGLRAYAAAGGAKLYSTQAFDLGSYVAVVQAAKPSQRSLRSRLIEGDLRAVSRVQMVIQVSTSGTLGNVLLFPPVGKYRTPTLSG